MRPFPYRHTALAFALLLALPMAQAAEPISASKPAAADARVDVSNVRGQITVTAWSKNEVAVSGSLGEGSTFVFEGSGDALSVRIENPDQGGFSSWWGSSGPKEDTLLEISVPVAAVLDLEGVSADVRVSGIRGSREVQAESVSGDIEVDAGAERVELSSVSGDVMFTGETPFASLETVSGDIDGRGIGARVAAESVSGSVRIAAGQVEDVAVGTVSGDVEIETAGIGRGRIKVESMSGEVELFLPASSSARLEVESFSGRIESDFGEVEEEEHGPGSSLDTTIGGGDAQITLESFSGDVTIRKR